MLFAVFNGKTNNEPEMIFISLDARMTGHKLKKAIHPAILGLDVPPNSERHQTL